MRGLTLLMLKRGSPIASLAYTLWNIKVSGKCAMIADMATPYDSVDTTRDSNFASIRDSLYLLVSLNQYSISRTALETNSSDSKPAEGLLRVALFSKDLRLLKRSEAVHELQHQQPVVQTSGVDAHGRAQQVHITIPANAGTNLEPPNELNSMRQELAQDLRESRRKGVVPVFLSTLWFLFALAISIQGAFGYIGESAIAHDLALGLLLSARFRRGAT